MDDFLLHLFNQTLTNPLLDWLMPGLSLGALGALPALSLAFLAGTNRKVGWALLLALVTGLVIAVGWQYLALRPRPTDVRLIWPQPNYPSYPSGHAAASFAMALVLGLSFRKRRVWVAALGLAALIALSRVYLGHHYPSDILAGGVLGASIGAACYGLVFHSGRGKIAWRWMLWPQIGVVFLVTQMAYLGFLPYNLLRWPFADKVLHFVLFGLVVFWLNLWLKGRTVKLGNWPVAVAFIAPFSYAVFEEGMQFFSPIRTLDPGDLTCDLAGMLLFLWLSYRLIPNFEPPAE